MKIKLVFLLLFAHTIHSQNNYFELGDFTKEAIPGLEKKFHSLKKKAFLEQTANGALNHVVYVRNATDNFPASDVDYSYSESDNLVQAVTFYWDLRIGEALSQSGKMEQYQLAFDELVKSLAAIFGAPAPGQGILTQIEPPVLNGKTANYQRRVIWKKGTKTITATIVWAGNHGQEMFTTIKG